MIKNNIMIEGARIGFRNFSGKEGKFNPKGRKNFCVFLDQLIEVDAEFNGGRGVIRAPKEGPGFYTYLGNVLQMDGWNVRWLEPRNPEDEAVPYMQVAVSFDNIVPKIVLVSSHGKTVLGDSADDSTRPSVEILDWAEIDNVDLIIRPYNWSVNGKEGVKAYVKSMYVTIAEDEFEKKYYDVPDAAADSIGGCGNCEACDGSCGNEHI